MDALLTEHLTAYLKDFISEDRFNNIEHTLSKRTNHLSVVLEDLHKPHNANAVLRSCDGFGVQDVHIIENKNEFDTASPVTLGAHRWLTMHRYNAPHSDNVSACFSALRENGYKVIATTPHEEDSNIDELDIHAKVALVFGTERDGVSEAVIKQADGFVKIPMYGFSESFNISVSAAICLYELTKRLRQSDVDWQLEANYRATLRLEWIQKTIKAGDQLAARFLEEWERSNK